MRRGVNLRHAAVLDHVSPGRDYQMNIPRGGAHVQRGHDNTEESDGFGGFTASRPPTLSPSSSPSRLPAALGTADAVEHQGRVVVRGDGPAARRAVSNQSLLLALPQQNWTRRETHSE